MGAVDEGPSRSFRIPGKRVSLTQNVETFMRRFCSPAILFAVLVCLSSQQFAQSQERWSEEKANAWYQQQPWLVGANYIPASAINELEMWQAATFDPQKIDKELGWAEGLGMNTMRVFLHDLLWQQDPTGFK